MDVAELGLRLVGGSLEGVGIRHVDLHRACADVEGRKLVARLLQRRLLDIGQHEVDAIPRQCPADAEPDPVGGAGDERRLAGKFHRLLLTSSVPSS